MFSVNALLSRIGGLLDEEFLFAAWLPVILVAATDFGLLALFSHRGDAMHALAALSLEQKGVLSAGVALGSIAFAYLLGALHTAMLGLWCGPRAMDGLLAPLKSVQRDSWRRLDHAARASLPWGALQERFPHRVAEAVGDRAQNPSLAEEERTALHRLVDDALDGPADGFFKALTPLFTAYGHYGRCDALNAIYRRCNDRLVALANEERLARNRAFDERERRFGIPGDLRSTRLGNLVEAYNSYPARRYGAEASVLWPRLAHVIPTSYQPLLREHRIRLDFALTCATLYGITGFGLLGTLLAGGPPGALGLLAMVAVHGLAARMFYQVAVHAGLALGDVLRATCDLFRLDLLKALKLPAPANLEQERALWERYSQMVVYGAVHDAAAFEYAG